MKNLQNVTILLAYYFETIQVEHLKIIVVSFLHVHNVCTKFERNLRHASVFRVDLTRNDPYPRLEPESNWTACPLLICTKLEVGHFHAKLDHFGHCCQ